MNEHETIADIIADMRRDADGYAHPCIVATKVNYYADRLDAAHRHERGDAAKLREALKAIGGLCDRLMPTWDGSIGRIKDVTEFALAEPPRNCDLFATAEEARQAWLDDAGNWDEFGSPKLELHEWLFAPSTEKEGGDDGNE